MKRTTSGSGDVVNVEADGLLHLIDFDEPFGYSVVEAMACGSPVVANIRGSMAELIEDRVTGYLVTNPDEAVDAVDRARLELRRSAALFASPRRPTRPHAQTKPAVGLGRTNERR